jgi:hypothetical protein
MLAHCYTPIVHLGPLLMPIKGRSRALLQRVGRAGKDGTALAQGRSLPHAWTLVTPYCKRTRPGRGANTKAAGSTSHACLPPAALPPSRFASRRPILAGARGDNLLIGPGTPPGSKHRHHGSLGVSASSYINPASPPRHSIQARREQRNLGQGRERSEGRHHGHRGSIEISRSMWHGGVHRCTGTVNGVDSRSGRSWSGDDSSTSCIGHRGTTRRRGSPP